MVTLDTKTCYEIFNPYDQTTLKFLIVRDRSDCRHFVAFAP